MRSTSRVIVGCLRGRPGFSGRDFAAQRRLTRSRCRRRIAAGVTGSRRHEWCGRGITAVSAAISARSAQVSFGRAALRRSRSAIWWCSSKISVSFHTEDRRESLNQEGTRTASRTQPLASPKRPEADSERSIEFDHHLA
jgi:hypothetical protein